MRPGDADPEGTVRCPECGTRYRAPGGVLGGPTATYRCTRCGHMFPAAANPTDEDDDDDEQRRFDFDTAEPVEMGEPHAGADANEPGTPAFIRATPDTDVSDADLPPEPAFTATRSGVASEGGMTASRSVSGLRLGVRFEALVLVLFCGVGLYLAANPQQVNTVVAAIPMLGVAVGTGEQLVTQIGIGDVEGSPELLRGDRPGFIIRGRVVNNLDRPVGSIQVEGRIYGPAGEVARKAVYAGTKVSRRLVRGWTPAAIEMFEKIKPPKRYRLAPGDDDDFLIIFQDVPSDLTEFGCKVVAAYPVVGR